MFKKKDLNKGDCVLYYNKYSDKQYSGYIYEFIKGKNWNSDIDPEEDIIIMYVKEYGGDTDSCPVSYIIKKITQTEFEKGFIPYPNFRF